MKTPRFGSIVAAALLVPAAAVPVWASGGTGRLMDITTHVVMQMAGMAGAPTMPPRTLHKKVCVPPEGFDPRPIVEAETKGKCSITNYSSHGGDVSFDMVCSTPAGNMTGHSTFHSGSADVTGNTHAKMSAGGFTMTMDSTYSGKQVGTCNYTPPGKTST
ncbi:MAG: DUF3617 domain-containing protein [Rhodanobacteraceae bacterium]